MSVEEEWRAIPEHRGYEASSLGCIRSLPRQITTCAGVTRRLPGKMLRPVLDKQTGYLRVQLGRYSRLTPVHVYVLKAFVGECPEGQEGLHEDGVKTNNDRPNLSWGTRSDNNLDQVRHGAHPHATKIVCPCDHSLFPPNLRNKKHNYRECLACSRAHSFVRGHGLTKTKLGKAEFKAIADRYYDRIMEAT